MGKGIGSRRTAVAALTAALALVGPTAAFANGQKSRSESHSGPVVTSTTPPAGSSLSAQGVVQSVGSTTLVVRQLDGSTVTVPFDRRSTQFYVDNKHAQWTDVKPGYVLSATWKAGKPAPTLRFSRP